MAKEPSPAYQDYPTDYLADLNTQLMSLEEEGMLTRLKAYCWIEKSLPNDPRVLSALCKGKNPTQLVLSCFVEKNGRLFYPGLEKERDKQQKWREQKRKDGLKGANARWSKNNKLNGRAIAEPSEKDGKAIILPMAKNAFSVFSLQSSVSSFQSSEKGIAAQQASPQGDTLSLLSSDSKKPKDEAYEVFCAEFEQQRGIPYRRNQGKDFKGLAALRKQLRISGKGTPENWLQANENYFDTPMDHYTLADLCKRFDSFRKSALDRYKKPIENAGNRRVDTFGGPEFNPDLIDDPVT